MVWQRVVECVVHHYVITLGQGEFGLEIIPKRSLRWCSFSILCAFSPSWFNSLPILFCSFVWFYACGTNNFALYRLCVWVCVCGGMMDLGYACVLKLLSGFISSRPNPATLGLGKFWRRSFFFSFLNPQTRASVMAQFSTYGIATLRLQTGWDGFKSWKKNIYIFLLIGEEERFFTRNALKSYRK